MVSRSSRATRAFLLRALLVAGAVVGTAAIGACRSPVTRHAGAAMPPGVEAWSLLGDTLRARALPAEERGRLERQLAEAEAALRRAPTDADSIIWVGRRLAYLGRHRDAIATFTRGAELHPRDARFLRHRGHRYLTTRRLDAAIADLERAAALVAGTPDQVEPDGQPNARGIPIGTLHSNIDYHLGLAHYLKGDFARAVPVYRREVAGASNDDRRVSASYWLYMSLRRLGQEGEAAQLLAAIPGAMELLETGTYHRLLLLNRGALPADSLLAPESGTGTLENATAAYGVGAWHLYNGRPLEARRTFERIVAGGQWESFGYLAAEAELARMRAMGS
jgi:tetratricopeptide (TPR) repeat protein